MAVQSVPPAWYDDEHMVITLADVLRVQAETADRNNKRKRS